MKEQSTPQSSSWTTSTATAGEQSQQLSSSDRRLVAILCWCGILLVRVLVGYQPHSGQDNYHGRKDGIAYGGDLEAQRHWMEVTWNLPIQEWYTHDLEYWGLDYPPLSAYQSWLCGALSHLLVGQDTVALYTSRYGTLEQNRTHKAFMRATVLVLDLLCYCSAVYYIALVVIGVVDHTVTTKTTTTTKLTTTTTMVNKSKIAETVDGWSLFVTALLQPALLLIDHGHFQYNTVALGLALWSFALAANNISTSVLLNNNRWKLLFWQLRYDVAACILFTCALSFKQMTLYYAPAIFSYLLGKCFGGGGVAMADVTRSTFYSNFVLRFFSYGMAVIVTFVITWWPFLVGTYPLLDEEEEDQDEGYHHHHQGWLLWQVLRRIFPLHRGVFEDKVANIWFVLSLGPLRFTDRIPSTWQPFAALVLTLSLSLPACIRLFQLGQVSHDRYMQHSRHNDPQQQQQDLRVLLLGASCTALSFFLGAFHVHEKSILLALAPASLVWQPNIVSDWFALVAVWSLWPLLLLDRLQVAYVCTIVIYICTRRIMTIFLTNQEKNPTPKQASSFPKWMQTLGLFGSMIIMIGLHGLELIVTPPSHLPHLFAVLWSIAGCGFYLLTWAGMVWQLYYSTDLLVVDGLPVAVPKQLASDEHVKSE